MRKQKVFSLIELLIVVAIILIIAAIAIPNLLRSKMSANDSAAASTLRTLNTAQVTYATNYPSWGYANTFTNLGPNPTAGKTDPITGAGLIDSVLAATPWGPNIQSGYNYYLLGVAGPAGNFGDYVLAAQASIIGSTGTNNFCSTAEAVVRSMKTSFPVATPNPAQGTGIPAFATCQTASTYGPIQ